MTIVNDDYSIVSKWSFKLSDDPRVVIYDCHRFIIQATGRWIRLEKRISGLANSAPTLFNKTENFFETEICVAEIRHASDIWPVIWSDDTYKFFLTTTMMKLVDQNLVFMISSSSSHQNNSWNSEGKSAAIFCCQRSQIHHICDPWKLRNFLICVTKFKNNQILLDKISHRFLPTKIYWVNDPHWKE